MRASPASQLMGRRKAPVQDKPREGSKLRALYDVFYENRGYPVRVKFYNKRAIKDLIDYYGMDVRCVKPGVWVLAGEWFGRVYVDYIAERLTAPPGLSYKPR